MAVELMALGRDRLSDEVALGRLDEEDAATAVRELTSIFDLFGDKDVLDLFRIGQSGEAPFALRRRAARRLGVADQRPETWFLPFGGNAATGHLGER
jgi:hypothetical protein